MNRSDMSRRSQHFLTDSCDRVTTKRRLWIREVSTLTNVGSISVANPFLSTQFKTKLRTHLEILSRVCPKNDASG